MNVPKASVPCCNKDRSLTSLKLLRSAISGGSTFRRRVLSTGLWTSAGFGAQKLIQLASNLILTRLLFPEAFGVMALASVVLIGLEMLSDVGIKQAVIQSSNGKDQDFLNTAWTIQIFRGFALWAAAGFFSYPIGNIYGQPELIFIIACLAATCAINGFASMAIASSERNLEVGRLTIVHLTGQIVTIIITVALAWILRSVWALVYGSLVGSIVVTVMSHVVMPTHGHRIKFDRLACREILHIGKWVIFGTAVTFLGGQGLRLIQGSLLSPSELGVLTIAQTLAWIPGDFATKLLNNVGFPALSEIKRHGTSELSRALSGFRIKMILFITPMFAVLAITSGPIVSILYDTRYESAGGYLMILSIGGSLALLSMGYQIAFMALGKFRVNSIFNLSAMALRISGLTIGFYFGNIEGMLVGIALGSIGNYVIVAIYAMCLGLYSKGPDIVASIIIGSTILFCWGLYG